MASYKGLWLWSWVIARERGNTVSAAPGGHTTCYVVELAPVTFSQNWDISHRHPPRQICFEQAIIVRIYIYLPCTILPGLHLTYSWRVTIYMDKQSAVGQLTMSTEPCPLCLIAARWRHYGVRNFKPRIFLFSAHVLLGLSEERVQIGKSPEVCSLVVMYSRYRCMYAANYTVLPVLQCLGVGDAFDF